MESSQESGTQEEASQSVLWKRREAGGLAPGWQGTELRSRANGRRGKRLSPALHRGKAKQALRVQPTEAGTTQRGRRGGTAAAESARRKRCLCRSPQPLPSLTAGSGRNFGGHGGNIPTESGDTVSSELRLFTFPAGVSGLLPSGGGGDREDDCRCSARCFTNLGSGK